MERKPDGSSIVSSKEQKISSMKTEKNATKELFNLLFNENQTVCIKGRRKTGKSKLVMEFIVQNLLTSTDNEILLIASHGNFDIGSFHEIFQTYLKDKTKEATILSLMKRLKVIRVDSEEDFNGYISCLEALTLGLPKLSLIIVDSISFFHHDSYIFKKIYEKELTIDMYLNHYQNIFSNIVNQCNVSMIYTIPEHLVTEYAKKDVYGKDDEEEERVIFEHMKSKYVNIQNFKSNIPKMKTNDKVYIPDKHEKRVSKRISGSNLATINEGVSSLGIKEQSIKNDEGCVEYQDSNKSDSFCDNNSENSGEGYKSDTGSEESDPVDEKIPEKNIHVGIKEQSIKNDEGCVSSVEIKTKNVEYQDSNKSDSFSDNSSENSGEGYKSDTGSEESDSVDEKISEKNIHAMFQESKADVIIKLVNISSNNYIMKIKKDNEEFGINYDITDNGIEWDYVVQRSSYN